MILRVMFSYIKQIICIVLNNLLTRTTQHKDPQFELRPQNPNPSYVEKRQNAVYYIGATIPSKHFTSGEAL